jgi:F0F1-type ATP synthase membrane subunit c/vacuolar-type H+-ATPase subunit K
MPDLFEDIRPELQRLKRFWALCICLPLLYLIICIIINKYVFLKSDVPGFVPLSQDTYRVILILFATIIISGQIAILLLKTIFARSLKGLVENATAFAELLRRQMLILAVICDTVAILGLVLFLLNGDLRTMFFSGIIALVYYAQIYPSESSVRKIIAHR